MIQRNGIQEFEKQEKTKEELLNQFIAEFDDGRSKTLYCIAATIMEKEELERALYEARRNSGGLAFKEKAQLMHSLLEDVAAKKGYILKLRK